MNYETHETDEGLWAVSAAAGRERSGFPSSKAAERYARLLHLEDAVAFLREHPELDFAAVDLTIVVPDRFDLPEEEQRAATLAALGALARTLASGGKADKSYGDELVKVVRKFGPHSIRALAWTRNVCERVKVGEQTIPATEERTVPIYETKCPPLLPESADESA